MTWKMIDFEEIALNCETNRYRSAEIQSAALYGKEALFRSTVGVARAYQSPCPDRAAL